MADAASVEERLKTIGGMADRDVPLVETLRWLAAIEANQFAVDDVNAHFTAMRDALTVEVATHAQGAETVTAYRLARLNAIIIDQFGYAGDDSTNQYDAPENISFLKLVERRRGIPVALGVIYLDLARSQGWAAHGLNFPGHFLLRLEHGAERLIVNPFGGVTLDAGGLRRLLKSLAGPQAELQHSFYDPVSARDVVLRFCNNRKTRLIAQSDYAAALTVIGHELWVAPNEPRLYYDTAVLCIKLGRIDAALDALYHVIELSKDRHAINEAKDMIHTLQHGLH